VVTGSMSEIPTYRRPALARRRMTPGLRHSVQSEQTGRSVQIAAPVSGWNARDPIAAMRPGDAFQLDNWICRPGYIEIRKGFIAHALGFTAPPESFLPYRSGTIEKQFVAAGDSIYDTTESGDLGAAVVTGLTSARFKSVNFANDAGIFLLGVNGEDDPQRYDGTTWDVPVITGMSGSITLDSATLIDVMAHKRRLFFIEKSSLRVWYLDTDAIQGTAGLLDMGPVFSQGGSLVGMGTWSPEGGNQNVQSVAAFVTDQGEIAVFVGSDPDDATNWSLEGVYQIAKPLGRKAVFQTTADLIIVTYDGAVPLSVVRTSLREEQRTKAITSRIQNAFALAAGSYGTNFGWEAVVYPSGQLAMINVPIAELGTARQFVQSTQTGAWSQFLGINATCWVYINGQMYFGGTDGSGDIGVFRWDTGGSDNGTAIQCDCINAFEKFGVSSLKNFTMLRPILRAGSMVRPYVDMLIDYTIRQPTNIPDGGVTTGSGIWGESLWGVGYWTSGQPITLNWTTVGGIGYAGAPRIRVISNPERSDTDFAVWDESDWNLSDWATGSIGVYPVVRCELIGFDGLFTQGGAMG
jgi:hypothetical protein